MFVSVFDCVCVRVSSSLGQVSFGDLRTYICVYMYRARDIERERKRERHIHVYIYIYTYVYCIS